MGVEVGANSINRNKNYTKWVTGATESIAILHDPLRHPKPLTIRILSL